MPDIVSYNFFLPCSLKNITMKKLMKVMEFQLSYFKSWKMMLWKCSTQYASKFGKLSSATGLEKVSFHSNPQKKGNAKECSNYCTIALIWHTRKVMLKILQARLQQSVNQEPRCSSWIQARYSSRGSEIKLQVREFQKTSTSVFLTMPKPLTVWIITNYWKLFKRWEYQITLPASWETSLQVKKQQLEPDMEQQTGSKLGKEYVKAVYCHPVYLTYM